MESSSTFMLKKDPKIPNKFNKTFSQSEIINLSAVISFFRNGQAFLGKGCHEFSVSRWDLK